MLYLIRHIENNNFLLHKVIITKAKCTKYQTAAAIKTIFSKNTKNRDGPRSEPNIVLSCNKYSHVN